MVEDRWPTPPSDCSAEWAESEEQAPAFRSFLSWSQKRFDKMNARLTPEVLSLQLADMEAFSSPVPEA
jgi:hypothetical protein